MQAKFIRDAMAYHLHQRRKAGFIRAERGVRERLAKKFGVSVYLITMIGHRKRRRVPPWQSSF